MSPDCYGPVELARASVGSDAVAGAFLKHGKATGTVTSRFDAGSSGEMASWTATS
jgi:hypothetical protein